MKIIGVDLSPDFLVTSENFDPKIDSKTPVTKQSLVTSEFGPSTVFTRHHDFAHLSPIAFFAEW